jgi:hypothetical protein
MTTTIQNIITTFDRLPAVEQNQVAALILQRTLQADLPPLNDEELVLNAEEIFLELDRREAEDGES